jgi:hypothetical protein
VLMSATCTGLNSSWREPDSVDRSGGHIPSSVWAQSLITLTSPCQKNVKTPTSTAPSVRQGTVKNVDWTRIAFYVHTAIPPERTIYPAAWRAQLMMTRPACSCPPRAELEPELICEARCGICIPNLLRLEGHEVALVRCLPGDGRLTHNQLTPCSPAVAREHGGDLARSTQWSLESCWGRTDQLAAVGGGVHGSPSLYCDWDTF